jgi:predicted nucleic acid-binding protein
VIVFDASVLVAFLDAEDDHHGEAEALLSALIDEEFGANSLTLAEILVAPVRNGRTEAVLTAVRELEVEELPFPVGAALRLALLRAATGLKVPDCCVLLATEDAGAVLASFDDRLVQAAEHLDLATVRR